jgi:hypothetical protein
MPGMMLGRSGSGDGIDWSVVDRAGFLGARNAKGAGDKRETSRAQ